MFIVLLRFVVDIAMQKTIRFRIFSIKKLTKGNPTMQATFAELKHAVNGIHIDGEETSSGFSVNDASIIFNNGMIIINKDGIDLPPYSIQDFLRTPNAIFRRIQKDVFG